MLKINAYAAVLYNTIIPRNVVAYVIYITPRNIVNVMYVYTVQVLGGV